MKKGILLLLLFGYSNSLISQDLKKVDKFIRSYKNPVSIESLSKRIDYDFKMPIEKVRAAFTWVALNIRYYKENSNLLEPPKFRVYFNEDDLKRAQLRNQENKIKETFYKREAVCEGYALLLKKIFGLLDIENELIYGYSKSSVNSIGIIPSKKNHVWNAVKIGDKWMMLDATYASGEIYLGAFKENFKPRYFNAKKEMLSTTHYPSEKRWQKFLSQKKLKTFCNDPFIQNAYFKHRIAVLEPKEGTIILEKEKNIRLEINGLKNDQSVKYLYAYDKVVRIPKMISKKSSAKEIYFKKPNQNTTLHIYVENELALEYKIVMR